VFSPSALVITLRVGAFRGAGTSSEDFPTYRRIAEAAEAAKLDFLFVGDNVACLFQRDLEESERQAGYRLKFQLK
jgi:alkanesulfonate monooxygenase SsuD/methylene tetrahydromethanopterin reductase-like flavin-dependent oxidoreductase (luciferase family)